MAKIKNSSCPRCGYTKKGTVKLGSKEKIESHKDVAVVKKDFKTEPIVVEICPKCGHDKAYFWTVQTRASDESPTKFFKCVKCGHTKRDYR